MNNIKKLEINRKNIFLLITIIILCYDSLFKYFVAAFYKNFAIPLEDYFVIISIVSLITTLLLFPTKRKLIIYSIPFILFLCLIIYKAINNYPSNATFIMERLKTVIFPCLPFFLLGLCFETDDKSIDIVGKWSCVAIFITFAYTFYYRSTGREFSSDNMTITYALMFNTLFVINYFFKNKTMISFVAMAIGLFFALSMGTRGPLVVESIFLVISIWRFSKLSRGYKVFLTVLLGILLFLIVFAFINSNLSNWLSSFLASRGYSTRIIDFLVKGNSISDESAEARGAIYSKLWNLLLDKPYNGYGIYGEWPIIGWNAHNIYLEVLFHFGFIMGFLIITIYILLFILCIKKTNSVYLQQIFIMLGCYVFINGVFGVSYFNKWVFLLLGLCINQIINRKRRNDL